MIYLGNFEKINDTKWLVCLQHNKPDALDKEVLDRGVLVEKLPKIVIPDGKQVAGLYYNPITKELWYEYADIPPQTPTIEESVNELGQQLAQEKLKNMQKDSIISQLGQELSKLKLDIMQLKGGM